MDFIRYNFGVILILFVGLSFCGDPQEIASYDPEEFDVLELLNNPLVIEALESNKTNVEEGPSQHEPSDDEITPTSKRKRNKPQISRKVTCLGMAYKGNKEIRSIFENLQPAKKNPDNLALSTLELKFYGQGDEYQWRELEEYPMQEYKSYWAHVCDYFWVKENPKESRNRACFIKSLLFSESAYGLIKYNFHQLPPSRAEVLRCICYYYVKSCRSADSPSVNFAVHKRSDNEYFILTKVMRGRITYTVFNFWTKVMLPFPIK